MKKFSLILSVVILAASVNAQQLQTSSMYDLQGMIHNPAMAGTSGKALVGVSYRTQWSSYSGSPKTATVFGSMALPQHNIGVGGYLYNDQTGPTSRTGLALAFAKHIPMPNDAKFSLGIEARGLQYSIDVSKLQQTLGNDPVLASGNNKFKFDAGFGVAYTAKNFEVGASVAQLIQSKLGYYAGNMTPAEEGRLYRHFYLHGSYKWRVDETAVITPNFMMIYLTNAPTEFHFGARVEHNEIFWWGLGYRVNQSFVLSAGVNVNGRFKAGYAFDIYSNPISVYEKGANAHEILLSYNLGK
jgi:type IX secretion system PorP/SprF family membrane protein